MMTPAIPAATRMLASNCRTESNTISIDPNVNIQMVVMATFFRTTTRV